MTPSLTIQWHGTDACTDLHCACGQSSHFDGDFLLYLRCPHCDLVWKVGTRVDITAVSQADEAGLINEDRIQVAQR